MTISPHINFSVTLPRLFVCDVTVKGNSEPANFIVLTDIVLSGVGVSSATFLLLTPLLLQPATWVPDQFREFLPKTVPNVWISLGIGFVKTLGFIPNVWIHWEFVFTKLWD